MTPKEVQNANEAGQTWSIENVAFVGGLYSGSVQPTSLNVFFYANSGGRPGAQVASRTNLAYIVSGIDYNVGLPTPVVLTAGTYWLSIQANLNYDPEQNQWGWQDRTRQAGNPTAYLNPGGGFGVCPSWCGRAANIPNGGGPDQVFELDGRLVSPPTITPTATRTATPTMTVTAGTGTATSTPTTTATATATPRRPNQTDFDGDGKADVLWNYAASGQNVVWLMNGFSINWQVVTSVPPGWSVVP